MKKLFAAVISLTIAVGLCSCGQTIEPKNIGTSEPASATEQQPEEPEKKGIIESVVNAAAEMFDRTEEDEMELVKDFTEKYYHDFYSGKATGNELYERAYSEALRSYLSEETKSKVLQNLLNTKNTFSYVKEINVSDIQKCDFPGLYIITAQAVANDGTVIDNCGSEYVYVKDGKPTFAYKNKYFDYMVTDPILCDDLCLAVENLLAVKGYCIDIYTDAHNIRTCSKIIVETEDGKTIPLDNSYSIDGDKIKVRVVDAPLKIRKITLEGLTYESRDGKTTENCTINIDLY